MALTSQSDGANDKPISSQPEGETPGLGDAKGLGGMLAKEVSGK